VERAWVDCLASSFLWIGISAAHETAAGRRGIGSRNSKSGASLAKARWLVRRVESRGPRLRYPVMKCRRPPWEESSNSLHSHFNDLRTYSLEQNGLLLAVHYLGFKHGQDLLDLILSTSSPRKTNGPIAESCDMLKKSGGICRK